MIFKPYWRGFKDSKGNDITPDTEAGPVLVGIMFALFLIPTLLFGMVKGFVGMAVIQSLVGRFRSGR